jgi:lipoyl(octanoyl) transferase
MSLPITLLGPVDYAPTAAAMQAFTEQRGPDTADALWICEHPPVYTQGLAGKADHILNPGSIPIVQTNRGGQVTYHGPGQVVAYPLIDLQRAGYYVKEYVYRIEEAVIRTLVHFGVTGHRVAGAPGIYVRLEDPFSHAALTGPTPAGDPFRGLGKIAALGIKANQPLRLCRIENGGPFYNRRLRCVARGRADAEPEARDLPDPLTKRAVVPVKTGTHGCARWMSACAEMKRDEPQRRCARRAVH